MDLSNAEIADDNEPPSTDGGMGLGGAAAQLERKAVKLLTKKLGREPTEVEIAKKVKNLKRKGAAEADEEGLRAKATKVLSKKLGRAPTADEIARKVKRLQEKAAAGTQEVFDGFSTAGTEL